MDDTYPCNYCGSCPIWLAAFDADEVSTYDKLEDYCKQIECVLVGKKVDSEDIIRCKACGYYRPKKGYCIGPPGISASFKESNDTCKHAVKRKEKN